MITYTQIAFQNHLFNFISRRDRCLFGYVILRLQMKKIKIDKYFITLRAKHFQILKPKIKIEIFKRKTALMLKIKLV